jgi:hypothetical protein
MARRSKHFSAFKLKLNQNQSREEAVDEALRLLEENYFTSEDITDDASGKDDSEPDANRSDKETETTDSKAYESTDARFKALNKRISEQKKHGKADTQLLDDVLGLLENARLNSDDALRIKRKRRTTSAIFCIFASIFFILAAAAMIIIDLPLWLKGSTLVQFSSHDGITVSDALAILMIGIGTLLAFMGFAEFLHASRNKT